MVQRLQIGKVARDTGVSIDTIRFYEKQRLLKRASRTEGGFRVFDAQDLRSLEFIRGAQALGFSLNEIRDLLFLQNEQVEACTQVQERLKAKLASVRNKISELRKLERQLAKDLKKCGRSLRRGSAGHDTCPVLEEIAGTASKRRKGT